MDSFTLSIHTVGSRGKSGWLSQNALGAVIINVQVVVAGGGASSAVAAASLGTNIAWVTMNLL